MNERNKKVSIDASNNNEHYRISADMSTSVTLDLADLINLLQQAITKSRQLQTILNQINDLTKARFGVMPFPLINRKEEMPWKQH